MQVSIDTTKWYDRIWASLIFFTRIPFWRLHQPPKEAYQTVVEHWPLAGWITGSVMGAVIYFGCQLFSYELAILLAIVIRLLLTGALHEDGLADFMDGFGGGGKDRQRILDIMKDSHIGTYGVIGLIMYFLLLFFALHSLAPLDAALTIAMADPYAKMLSAQLIQMMPYARNEETAKNRVVYRQFNIAAGISLAIQGLLPMAAYIYNVRENRLAMAAVRSSHRYVFPLPAHLEPAQRLYRRLLRSTLSHHRTDHPLSRHGEYHVLIPQPFCKVDLAL